MTPEAEIAVFNREFPVGTDVLLRKDGVKDLVATRTRSEAHLMCGQAVVFLEGVSGCYRVSHVFPKKGRAT